MKIQELAIIFIIIILPISLVLSEYTQFQIQTISLQTEYDAKLTSATYDAIKAFQLNSTNSTTSDLANSKMRDLEASINSFRNSIISGFKLNGYTEEELNNYIPALVYTLYDGFYIYSPYENIVDEAGNILEENMPRESLYGIKPYINYSCRYIKDNIDVVITYALDNYITVKGTIEGEYVNRGGYLIDGIDYDEKSGIVKYNGIEIETEHLKEELLVGKTCSYVRVNGTKYYLLKEEEGEEYFQNSDEGIVYILNGELTVQTTDPKEVTAWKILMENNDSAITYYRDAWDFTERWFKTIPELMDLTYRDAFDVDVTDQKEEIKRIWEDNTTKIFDFKSTENPGNIENELSNFNQHRLAVIRHKIETNLAIAISNYNIYSGTADFNVFQMPELKENEWDDITHNISLISFLQGLHIGGKIYNGYTVVTNSQSNEVVMEDDIYYLGYNTKTNNYNYHKMGDHGLEDGTVQLSTDKYGDGKLGEAGRLNLDFERTIITDSNKDETYYYYPLKDYNASYESIVMQDNVEVYNDIYEYVDKVRTTQNNDDLAKTFYTALGRERYSTYRATNEIPNFYSILLLADPVGNKNYEEKVIPYIINHFNQEKGIMAKYENMNLSKEEILKRSKKYHLIIADKFVWPFSDAISSCFEDIVANTNLFTISNDECNLPIMKNGAIPAVTGNSILVTPSITDGVGSNKLNVTSIEGWNDTQAAFKFAENVEVFYTGTYSGAVNGTYDLIGCCKFGNYNWMHSQVSINPELKNHMKLFRELISYTVNKN